MRKLAAAAAALTVATIPSYADAAISTFAQYNQKTTARDVVYKASTTGTGGTLSSRASASSAAYTKTAVSFDFLVDDNSGNIAPIDATLLFKATTSAAAQIAGNIFVLSGFDGTFDFVSTKAFTINGTTYPALTELLGGSFTNASLVGTVGGTSGGVFDSSKANVTYNDNDVISFPNDKTNDLAFALTSVTNPFAVSGAGKVASFSAAATGSFSSDPTPEVAGSTPELATWSMMLMGFGLIGGTIRSRRIGAGIRLPVRAVEFA